KQLLDNKGIVRNKLKIEAAVQNARSYLAVLDEIGSFDDYIWKFTDGKTIRNAWQTISQIPAWTNESIAMSKDLKKRGFKFVGPTICYAFMQAAGMVNDHLVSCFRYHQV
ncbi:MAG: DNA-3-methyladenine glycosylase I, partial [Desulfobacterales bacterium]